MTAPEVHGVDGGEDESLSIGVHGGVPLAPLRRFKVQRGAVGICADIESSGVQSIEVGVRGSAASVVRRSMSKKKPEVR